MSVLAHTSCRLTRVRNANSRTEKGRPRNRTKWTYDADGNRLSWSNGSATSTFSIASTSNEITGITGTLNRTYAYDAAGNTLSDSSDTDTYDDAGRLKTIANTSGTTTFIYNALGQMIDESGPSGTTLYVYDQAGHVLGEYGGAGSLIQETVWLGDIPVATIQPSGSSIAIYYIESDQLDAPRAIIRPSDNALMWSWFSGPFGIEAPNTNPQGAGTFAYDLRFPGQIAGSWGSTYQNYMRDYDPQVGRYVEADPIGLWGRSYSTYAYALNNPISNADPSGLAPPSRTGTPTLPTVLPPNIAIPGTSENNAWVQLAWQQIENDLEEAAQEVHNLCENSEEARCRKVLEQCREQCVDTYVEDPNSLPGIGKDMQGRLRRCIRECTESHGCNNF